MIDPWPYILFGGVGFMLSTALWAFWYFKNDEHWIALLRQKEKEMRKHKALYELHKQTEEEGR